ncbi:MAG: ABC transporter permease [Polyangiales bacterium]
MSRFFAICWKEFIQLRRDRVTLFMMAGMPVVQLLFFGYAINTDVRNIPTVVFDQDGTPESRDLVRRMEATGFYQIVGHVRTYAEIGSAMRTGRARVAIVMPPAFGQKLRSATGAQAQLVVDGSDPQTVASASNTAASLVVGLSTQMLVSRLLASSAGSRVEPVTLEPTTWYNPELKTAVYVVPGLIGVILTTTMVMLTAVAIARERERGTLEQLIVSPVRRFELVAGKIIPYVLIGYVQMTLILSVGRAVFSVPFVGSVALLYGLGSFFIATCLAVGLFFSTIAQNQQQALQMSSFFLLPSMLLSGFMFPYEGMPRPAQWVAQIFPLTHFIRIVRGITLKGASYPELAGEVVWLGCILMVVVVATALRFSKKLA